MNAASFSTNRMNNASDLISVTRSTFGGIAFPPTPIREQSIASPSSRNCSLPTTTPFSEATTCSDERVQPSMHATSSSTASECVWSSKSLTSV